MYPDVVIIFSQSSVNIAMDSVSSNFEVSMGLFSDDAMAVALDAEHEGNRSWLALKTALTWPTTSQCSPMSVQFDWLWTLVNVPDPIYGQIGLEEGLDFHVQLRTCWATPTDDAANTVRYTFIDNFAAVEATNMEVTNNCAVTPATFWINSFAFVNEDGKKI